MSFIKLRLYSLLLTCVSLPACTTIQDKETPAHQAAKIISPRLVFESKEDVKCPGIDITEIYVDTAYTSRETRGIRLSFITSIDKEAFKKLEKESYTSYYIHLTCNAPGGLPYSSLREINKSRRIRINKDRFFSAPSHRQLEFQLPYRLLEMKEGTHELALNIQVLAVRFAGDTSSPDFRFVDKISEIPTASIQIKVKISTPRLYKAVVEVYHFKLNINVVDPQKYDFSLGGPGYPDLYWDLHCGEDLIYYSPQQKNTIEYKKTYISTPFYCSADDIITLHISDFDNGPFNTEDDIVDTWSGRIEEFPTTIDTLSFGKLEYLVMKSKILQ